MSGFCFILKGLLYTYTERDDPKDNKMAKRRFVGISQQQDRGDGWLLLIINHDQCIRHQANNSPHTARKPSPSSILITVHARSFTHTHTRCGHKPDPPLIHNNNKKGLKHRYRIYIHKGETCVRVKSGFG